MNGVLKRNLVAAAALLYLILSQNALAAGSKTGTERINPNEGSWLVEISTKSYFEMMAGFTDRVSLLTTMQGLEHAFNRLQDEENSDSASLGFHWHIEHEKSMCNLYRVIRDGDVTARSLARDKPYAALERKHGSCWYDGVHIFQFVREWKERKFLEQSNIWGVAISSDVGYAKYVPNFAIVDEVPISVGLVPVSQDFSEAHLKIPAERWKSWVASASAGVHVGKYADSWMGLGIEVNTATLDRSDWKKWVESMPISIIQSTGVDAWPFIRGFADTPPVYIGDWIDWSSDQYGAYLQSNMGAGVMVATEWEEVDPRELEWVDESDDLIGKEALAAAGVSALFYGTPALGTLIASVCPPEFLERISKCLLPKFGEAAIGTVEGPSVKLLRVPFAATKEWRGTD